MPYGFEGLLGSCIPSYRAARAVGRVVPRPARAPPRHPRPHPGHGWLSPFQWPVVVGRRWIAADGLIEAAEATGNPHMLAWALTAYGFAFRDADPVGALNALGRGLVIAQDSGNRAHESALAPILARLEAEHGDTAVRVRLPHSGNPQLPRFGQHHHDPRPTGYPRRSFRPARTLRTGGHHRRFRRSVPWPQRGSPKSPPRSPIYVKSSATRPTKRSPARVRR